VYRTPPGNCADGAALTAVETSTSNCLVRTRILYSLLLGDFSLERLHFRQDIFSSAVVFLEHLGAHLFELVIAIATILEKKCF
jgi:hypothetical protein